MSARRPFPVTLLAFVVLSFTALNLLRFGAALVQWPVLAEFATRAYALYIAATGLSWALIGLALFIGLWRGLKSARWGGLIVIAAYTGYYWLDRLVIQKMPAQNTMYVLGLQAIVLVFCVLTLVGAKGYFIKTVK
jgi:hypothetical protein